MSGHLQSQVSALYLGVKAFESYINDLHEAYRKEEFVDWPTVILATTIQTTVISLFKLLPPSEPCHEPLDKRSIATIIRNVVDTHDVLDMLTNAESDEEFNLHRDIMGLYLSGRINKVQTKISAKEAQDLFKRTKSFYWKMIKQSKLYDKSMDKLKNGESIFYRSRQQRVEKTCGQHSDFVMGVLTDLSTYVHSIPPSIWMSNINDLYSDNKGSRDLIAVWLRVANFYFSKCIELVLKMVGRSPSSELMTFLNHHKYVFSK